MMRRLVERHHGILPLDTAESIWRVIIATFTYVQAPFSVHADLSAGDAAMRDSARASISASRCRSCRIWAPPAWSRRSRHRRAISAWCRPSRSPAPAPGGARSKFDAAPKIIARLPFVERADHPAALPVFVISRAGRRRHGDRGRDVERAGRRLERRRPRARSPPLAEVDRGAGPRLRRRGAAGLGAARRRRSTDVSDALVKAGASVRSSALVGSHATRYTVPAARRRPRPTAR